jgi:hypothetical protein
MAGMKIRFWAIGRKSYPSSILRYSLGTSVLLNLEISFSLAVPLPRQFVDYTDQYYVNAKRPLAGSANVDAKVAEDGSLSEASGQVESKTFETILGALPISSVITGALGLGTKAVAPGNVEAFTLTVSVSGYRHTLARLVDYPNSTQTKSTPPCPVVKEISLADASEYKREDMAAPTDSGKGDKKSDTGSQKKTGKTDKGKDSTSEKDSSSSKNAEPNEGDNSADDAMGKDSVAPNGHKKPQKTKA